MLGLRIGATTSRVGEVQLTSRVLLDRPPAANSKLGLDQFRPAALLLISTNFG